MEAHARSNERDDSYFATEWRELGETLRVTGRPPAIDRRGKNPDPPPPRSSACVVQLGLAEGRWAMPISGTQVFEPGAVVWALSANWLSRDGDDLLCHCGLWADRAGQLFLDDFSPPRRVTYFANFLTRASTYGQRSEGVPLEAGLACPQSSCTEIVELTGCKVTTRLLAGRVGVRIPQSIALTSVPPTGVLKTHRHPDVAVLDGSMLVPQLRENHGEARRELEREILSRLEQWPVWINRVIVKPSGLMHLQCRGVRILPRHQPSAIIDAIIDLVSGRGGTTFECGDNVLIDAFVGGQQSSVRVRAIASRTEDDRATALGFICSAASSDRLIGGASGWPQSLHAVLLNARVPHAERRANELEAELRRFTEATLEAIFATDFPVASKPRARTDLLGLDFIIALPGDTAPGQAALSPTLIEVNDHDCTDIGQLYGYSRQRPMDDRNGSPQDHLIDTHLRAMLTRSQRYLLNGKRLLLVGGTTWTKRRVWERARACGVRLVLVASQLPAAELGFGSELESVIVIPNLDSDHTESAEQAICESVIATLAERKLDIDGVLCVWEDSTVLAARLAERLGLPGHPVAAQSKAKDKLKTHAALMTPLADAQYSVQPNPETLAVETIEIRSLADLESPAAQRMGFPAVLRTAYGSAAVGTRVVRNIDEARRHVGELLGLLHNPQAAEARYPGGGFAFDSDRARLFLCEYLDGNEYDVDLVMFEGQLVDAWVTDNGVTDLPCCAEVCEIFPSALEDERQQQLISAAWLTCQRLGLRSGVVNVELKFSRFGPKILEVNGRMGGFYIPDWVLAVWDLELVEQAMLIACGIRPVGRVRRTPRTWLAGVQIFAEQSADLDQPEAMVTHYGDHPWDPLYPEPIANVAYRGSSPQEAVAVAERGLGDLFRKNPERAATLVKRLNDLLPPSDP